jgi:hypothetical protein
MPRTGLATLCTIAATLTGIAAACFPSVDWLGSGGVAAQDAGGGDGPSDAAGEDRATSAPCPAGAFFCDDFESGDLSRWGRFAPSADDAGIVAVFSTDASVTPYQGSHALLAQRLGGTGAAEVAESIPPLAGGMLAMRVYVYIAGASDTPPSTSLLALLARSDAGAYEPYTTVDFFQSSGLVLGTNAYDSPDAGAQFGGALPVGNGAWFCLEWDVVAGGAATIFVDGRPSPASSLRTTVGYNQMLLGITHADQAAIARFDDFAAVRSDSTDIPDGGLIGCE